MLKNLESLSRTQLLGLVKETVNQPLNKEKRLRIIESIYDALGYEISNDVRLALLTETDRLLILALAGGGKTTTSIIKLALWQIIYGQDISRAFLVLVYNRANVDDVKIKYKNIINTLNKKLGYSLNSEISVMTLHELSRSWIKKYEIKLNINSYRCIKKNEDVLIMEKAIDTWIKKIMPQNCPNNQKLIFEQLTEDMKIKVRDIIGLYELSIEAMYTDEDLFETEMFQSVKIEKQDYKDIIRRYEFLLKHKYRVYTYAQGLRMFRDLVKNDEQAKKDLSIAYQKVIIDEVQDISPLMLDMLKYFVPKENQVIQIGDDDQCIYGYRGSSPKSILNFRETYKETETEILTLTLNRRCPKNIVKLSKRVLDLNKGRRFEKEMRFNPRTGDINIIPYSSELSERLMIANKLKELYDSGEEDIVVAYRNNSSSEIIMDLLKDARIPFYSEGSNCLKPFKYYLYDCMFSALDIVNRPKESRFLLDLWKITPLRKQEVHSVMDYNSVTGTYNTDITLKDFPIEKITTKASTIKAFTDVVTLSEKALGSTLDNYVIELLNLVIKYYYYPNKSKNHSFFLKSVLDYFNKPIKYKDFLDKHTSNVEFLHRNTIAKRGIRFSTFHALKGLGYNEVILMDMDDDIFPNTNAIQTSLTSPKQKQEVMDENNRLFYVAITRTKNNLTIYYNKDNPSLYVYLVDKFLKESDTSWFDKVDEGDIIVSKSDIPNKEREIDLVNNDINTLDKVDIDESSLDNAKENRPSRKWNKTKLADRLRFN